jgi:hypothetical protein
VKKFDERLTVKGRGLTGALTDLFRRNPHIHKKLSLFATKREVAPRVRAPVVTQKKLHEYFLSLCREAGLHKSLEWPFNTKRLGYKALSRWYRQKRLGKPIVSAINEFGDVEGGNTKAAYYLAIHGRKKVLPLAFERVEVDEHFQDGMFSIGWPINRQVIDIVSTRRLWALAAIDVRTTTILSSRAAFGERYNKVDFLRLIFQALYPPARFHLKFQNPDYQYREGAAYPAELPGLELNRWQFLAADGDAAHMATLLAGTFEQAGICSFLIERVGTPLARAVIERFFKVLTDAASWLPSATDRNPKGAARRNPGKAAEQLYILATLASELLDLICRNYNVTPNASCGGLTPLQFLQELVIKGEAYINPLGHPNKLWMLLPVYPGKLNRASRQGRLGPFYVELFGARYTSPEIANSQVLAAMDDWRVRVYVQEDARFAIVVPEANSSLVFKVAVRGKYSEVPHTLEWRRAYQNYTKNAVLAGRAQGPHPMLGFLKGLSAVAKEEERVATLLAGTVAFIDRYGVGEDSLIGTTRDESERLLEAVAASFPEVDEILDSDIEAGTTTCSVPKLPSSGDSVIF